MNKAEQRLASSRKAYLRRQEERAFSNKSEDVRAWEPEPTLELAAAFRPKEVVSMYATIRERMEAKVLPTARDAEKFRTY
jgi:hypothetical protein